MRNYKVVNDYTIFNYGFPASMEVMDNKSKLFYMIWKDDLTTICFDRNPSTPKGVGYTKILKEAFVFEFDDMVWYK